MKRQGNRLTPVAVRAANTPGLYGDGHGLYLQVSAFNTKAWVFRYMIDGRARKMGLGALHTVTLAEARAEAAEARKKVRKGIDPIEVQEAEKAERRLKAIRTKTFKECADAYIKANEATWKNDKHAAQWFSTFNETRRGKLKFPAITEAINGLPVAEIDTAAVHKVLEPIWYDRHETATRVRARIERVLAWATVSKFRTGDNPARWAGHLKELLPAKVKGAKVVHHDAVPYREMPAFMAELRERKSVSARALEFTILTAARTGETIGARWSEVDLDAKVWTVPPERTKAEREHRVPLSDRALAILAELPRDGAFVFAGAKEDKPLSNMAMLELVRGMRGKGATVHGFRSTFRDWAGNETNFPRELAEHALAHVIGDKAEQAYRRDAALERRRKMMAAWATYCGRPPVSVSDNKVVHMRETVA